MSACHSGFGRHVTSHAWLTADTAQDAATGHGNRCNGSIWRGCRGEEVCAIWYSTVRAFRQCNMGNASDAPCIFWYLFWYLSLNCLKMASLLSHETIVDFRHFPTARVSKLRPPWLQVFWQLSHLGFHVPVRAENPAGSALEDWVWTPLLQSIWKQWIHVENACLILQDIPGWKPNEFGGINITNE